MHDRARHKCIGNSTRALSEDSRDGLRQCRHECIYASRLNKIKETPAHPHEWGCERLWGSGRGRFKNTARDRSGISTAYPSWLVRESAVFLSLSRSRARKPLYRASRFRIYPVSLARLESARVLGESFFARSLNRRGITQGPVSDSTCAPLSVRSVHPRMRAIIKTSRTNALFASSP